MTSSFWQPIQNSTYTLGEKVLINNGVFPHAFWYWLGVAALFGYMILFNTIYTLALTYLNRQYNLTPVTIIRWVPIFLCLFFQSGQFTLLLLFFTKKKTCFECLPLWLHSIGKATGCYYRGGACSKNGQPDWSWLHCCFYPAQVEKIPEVEGFNQHLR